MISDCSEAKRAAAAAEMAARRKVTARIEIQELGGPNDLLVGGGGGSSTHLVSVLNRGGSNSFDIDHNGPPFSQNATLAGEELYDEESQISSSSPPATGEDQHDEESRISSSSPPATGEEQNDEEFQISSSPLAINVAISESGKNLAIDMNRQTTLIKSLRGCAGSYLIRGRNNPSQEISQGNAKMEMNNPYTLNVEDDEKNMLTVPTKGDAMIQKKDSDFPERRHCLQMLETLANWSSSAMIAIICANLSGSSANDKRAAMAVGRFGYAGVFFLSLLFKASRLFPSARPLLEARLNFIVGLLILLFCLVTISLLVVLPT